MPYEIELRLPALTSCLHVVTACVGRLCRTSVHSEDEEFQDAVYAACYHAIQKGYGGDNADARLELRFYVSDGELVAELTHDGAPAAAATAARLHGAVDEVRYERVGERNRLVLVRRARRRAQ